MKSAPGGRSSELSPENARVRRSYSFCSITRSLFVSRRLTPATDEASVSDSVLVSVSTSISMSGDAAKPSLMAACLGSSGESDVRSERQLQVARAYR